MSMVGIRRSHPTVRRLVSVTLTLSSFRSLPLQFHRLLSHSSSARSSLITVQTLHSNSNTHELISPAWGVALFLVATCCVDNVHISENKASVAGVTQTPVSSTSTTTSNSNTPTSASFQVATALDLKEEKEKVKLARFLREVHDVSESKRSTLLRRYTTVTSAATKPSNPRTDIKPQVVNGKISLKGVNLLSFTPAQAHALIAQLVSGECRLDRDSLVQLCKAAAIVLKRDETLVDLKDKETVTVVGDIHGSLSCLKQVLRFVYMTGNVESDLQHGKDTLVFNGDFVDRGPNGLEVLCTLLFLKLAYPDRVFLIRGNHEDTMVSSVYGFMEELQSKYERTDRIWHELSKVFGALPLAAITSTAFIVHGGIPQRGFQLEEVQSITTDERSKIGTVVDPRTAHERLVSGAFGRANASRLFRVPDFCARARTD
jgi:hypothetical protein